MVSATLLLLLGLLLVRGWSLASRAWKTVSEKNKVVTQAQHLLRLLERELEASSPAGVEVSTDPPCLAFASTFDTATRREFEADADSGALRWQKQVVYSYLAEDKTVWRGELAIGPGQLAYQRATPISEINFGSGFRPVPFYLGQGQPVAHDIESVAFVRNGLEVRIELQLQTAQAVPTQFFSTTVLRNR